MNKAAIAQKLAGLGFKVFPITAGAKFPPLLRDWPRVATNDTTAIEQLWTAVPDANIGIHCAGLLVVDVDVKNGGPATLTALRELRTLPVTLTTVTPTGGQHLFYRLPPGHPGVPNSVGKLGRGLDVRSTGGYVVAAGSDTEAGRYRFENPTVEIAAAPDWLITAAGEARVKAEKVEAVPDAPDDTYRRAAEWLAKHEPAVEGQGGDAHTYKTACALRDLGVSEPQCAELMAGEWNSRCSPPWELSDLKAKAHNAYRYAQEGRAGKLAVSAASFDAVADEAPPPPPAPRASKVRRLVELALAQAAGPGYLVKGVLQRNSYAVMYGAPGEGKTFVALDIAYCVAAGREWMGHKVRGGTVLYLAYEGAGGIVKRGQALRKHYGDADVPLYIDTASYDLRQQEGRHALRDTLATLPDKPVLVVVDTFARALMGGDENSAQDVGAFNAAVAALQEATGACVLVIHHSGKNKAAGARGSSALLGAVDTEIEIDDHKVAATKQRDVELGDPVGFALRPVPLGMDDDGDIVSSCVVIPDETPERDLPKLMGNPRRGWDVLCKLTPGNQPVHVDTWRDECRVFLGDKDIRKRFYDMKQALLDKGYAACDNQGMVTRRLQ